MIICEKKGGMMNSGNQTDVKRNETLKAIETLSLLDDNLMTLVFDRNIEASQYHIQGTDVSGADIQGILQEDKAEPA